MAERKLVDIEELARRTDRLEVKKQYDLDPEEYREILYNSHECFMAHISQDGYPMVSPMWYCVIDDIVHLTTIKDLRKKTAALRRNPKMSLILTNFSVQASDVKAALQQATITTEIIGRYLVPLSRLQHIKAILIKGQAELSDDPALRTKVSRVNIDKYYAEATPQQKADMVKAIDTPNRIIIKVKPVNIWHWDLNKMFFADE